MHNLRDNFISYALRIRKKKNRENWHFCCDYFGETFHTCQKEKKYIYVSLTYVSMYIAITLNITRKR